MGDTFDVAIAGAGIVGAACAAECASAGLKVVVVERAPIGSGATAAGMGHIVVMDDSPAQMALTRYSRDIWMALRTELPAEVEYLECGTLWVAADDEEMAEVRRKKSLYDAAGVRAEVLDGKELAKAEPHLRKGLAGALLVPEDSTIYPPRAAQTLMDGARAHGAEFRSGNVVQIGPPGLRLADGTRIEAGITVNATGSWAPELTPGLEVQKKKGHLVITDRYPGFVRHALVELGYLKSAHSSTGDSVAFNAQPRRSGQVLLGSSRQFGVEHTGVDSHMLHRMLERAVQYMPEIGNLAAIRTWTGFRAATPDKLPLIGPVPEQPRLYLATGHEGLGITTSLATGRLVADSIMGRAPAIAPEPYLPGRTRVQEVHS